MFRPNRLVMSSLVSTVVYVYVIHYVYVIELLL